MVCATPDKVWEFNGKNWLSLRSGFDRVNALCRARDAKLARTVRRCQDLPGQRLFQWVDEEGAQHPLTSTEVNDYLRETMNGPFTAKMLRTWSATVCACQRRVSASTKWPFPQSPKPSPKSDTRRVSDMLIRTSA